MTPSYAPRGPSTIPSTCSPNIILSSVIYVIPNHSPSGPYLLPYFIPDTLFTHSNLLPMSPSKELHENTSYDNFSPPRLIPY